MNKFKTTLMILISLSTAMAMDSFEDGRQAFSYRPCAYLPTHIQNMEETADDLAYIIQHEFNKEYGNEKKRAFRTKMEKKYQTCVNGAEIEMIPEKWLELCRQWEEKSMASIESFVSVLQNNLDRYALKYQNHPAFETMMLESKLAVEHNFYETFAIGH